MQPISCLPLQQEGAIVVPCTHLSLVCITCNHNTQYLGSALTYADYVQVLALGWVDIVGASRHGFAYLVEQKIWLAMRPQSGVDWACLSFCGLCILWALVSTSLAALLSVDATHQAALL